MNYIHKFVMAGCLIVCCSTVLAKDDLEQLADKIEKKVTDALAQGNELLQQGQQKAQDVLQPIQEKLNDVLPEALQRKPAPWYEPAELKKRGEKYAELLSEKARNKDCQIGFCVGAGSLLMLHGLATMLRTSRLVAVCAVAGVACGSVVAVFRHEKAK